MSGAEKENIILSTQGGYKGYLGSGWKLGRFYLSDQRLVFYQPSGIVFETPLTHIRKISVERQRFVLRTKETLCLSYRQAKIERVLKAWIITGDLEVWRKKLYELSRPKIDEDSINKVAQKLDPDSQEILSYLRQNRYARIDELAEVIKAPNHMDVLLRIKRVINPTAEEVIGSPLLSFEESKVDDGTGERIPFSWWIIGKKEPSNNGRREPLVDIFDEGDHITVIMESWGIEGDDIRLKVEEEKLIVFPSRDGKDYYEEYPLSARVNPRTFSQLYKNGVLQVKMMKLRD